MYKGQKVIAKMLDEVIDEDDSFTEVIKKEMAWVCQMCGYANLDRTMVIVHIEFDHLEDHSDLDDDDETPFTAKNSQQGQQNVF